MIQLHQKPPDDDPVAYHHRLVFTSKANSRPWFYYDSKNLSRILSLLKSAGVVEGGGEKSC